MAADEKPHRRWRLFRPILAGATGKDRLAACLGAVVAIAAVGVSGALLHGDGVGALWIVAPIGASAVLVFAVPASPLAQPWPVVGGNALSALAGLTAAAVLGSGALAVGVAVGLAIGVMSLTRSLHPPGGAMALTAALGGSVVDSAGWLFPLAPAAANSIALVAAAWVFHRLSGHPYPHRQPASTPPPPGPPPPRSVDIRPEDVDAVLARVGETFDIDRDDLILLLREVEAEVVGRQRRVRADG